MIEVRVDDLAFFRGAAIVRPVNADFGATTPVLRRLDVAAGANLASRLATQEPLPVGAAIVTPAGELEVELMVHGVVCSDAEAVSRNTVRRALTSALQRTVDWQLDDVAIAPFGLGAGNLEIEESAEIMAQVLADHLRRCSTPANVVFVVESDEERQAITFALARCGL